MKKFALIFAGVAVIYAIAVTAINFLYGDNEKDDYDVNGEEQTRAENAAAANTATC